MPIKKFKPLTPSQRFRTVLVRTGLHKGEPEATLIEALPKSGGFYNVCRST